MSRIKLEDSILDVFAKLSEGNPGALRALIEVQKHGGEIDPDSLDPLLTLLLFDTFGIYGPAVWVLYADVCGQNGARLIAVVRAAGLGLVPSRAVVEASREGSPRTALNVETLVAALRLWLPRFDPENRCGIVLDGGR